MLDPLDLENRPYIKALSHKRKRAFVLLMLENITLHCWRLFFWVLLFCGLWMLGIPAFLGQFISVITPIIFFIGIIYFIKKDICSLRLPSVNTIERALEKQSGFPTGSISIIKDTLANPKKSETRELWSYAQKKILSSFSKIKTPKLRAVLSRRDPAALRFIAILFFISGLMIAGDQWQGKIQSGIMPISPSKIISQGRTTKLWVKPPEYTQIGQTHLIGNGTSDTKLNIPEGSKIKLRIHSILGELIPPVLYNGNTEIKMTYIGDGLYGSESIIQKGNNIKIKQLLLTRANWEYNFIKDTPPEISIPMIKEKVDSYEILDNFQIRVPLMLRDDYGVKELHMRMEIDEMVEDLPLGNISNQSRLIMSQPNMEFKISPIYDMTWHTWAGLPVTFEYKAIDHKGQETTLDKISMTLPERKFEHPMAKALIAMRKRLAWDYHDSFIDISRNIEILLSSPSYFQDNKTIYLALRSASSRLLYSNQYNGQRRINAAWGVINLLWDSALAIEDGNLSLAMRELRDARLALENAMRDPNSSDQEIDALMDDLREKMSNYFAEMQRERQKRIANGEAFPEMSVEDFSSIISPDTLSKLMEQIESALRSGDTQKAQELMSQLQRMMEMIDPSMMPQLPMDMQAMHKGINELQELIDRQEILLNQTNDQANQAMSVMPRINTMPSIEEMMAELGMDNLPPAIKEPQDTPSIGVNTRPNKIEQEALRYILGQLMLDVSEKLDEIPETMGLAEQEMRLSAQALGENDPQSSIPNQEQAIKYLKDSQEELSKKFKNRMQQMVGIGFGGARRYDPLGRPYGGDNPNGESLGDDVRVPDAAQKKRVDEILKTLRQRSGDRNRPDEELNYFRRLLRQF